jgi:hypothetical protein
MEHDHENFVARSVFSFVSIAATKHERAPRQNGAPDLIMKIHIQKADRKHTGSNTSRLMRLCRRFQAAWTRLACWADATRQDHFIGLCNSQRRSKLGLLWLVCLMASMSSWGFALYNHNMLQQSSTGQQISYTDATGIYYAPQAAFDAPCALAADLWSPLSGIPGEGWDYWSWATPGAAQVTITYSFDQNFETLFGGQGSKTLANAENQVYVALNTWQQLFTYLSDNAVESQTEGEPSALPQIYGPFESYSRANPLPTAMTAQPPFSMFNQTISPFVDLRSAALHEIGHILGFAHCDDAAAVSRNFALFNPSPSSGQKLRGTGGMLGSYSGSMDELYNNYFLNGLQQAFSGSGMPGLAGQEVMSQHSSLSSAAFAGGMPILGRLLGEIYNALSWDEIDGIYEMYFTYGGVASTAGVAVSFRPASQGETPMLLFSASSMNPVTGQPFNSTPPENSCGTLLPQGIPENVVAVGLPYGRASGNGGVTIHHAIITFNSNPTTPLGSESTGYNFDFTADQTIQSIIQVNLLVPGTQNTDLVGGTFNNNVVLNVPDLNQDPDYVFGMFQPIYPVPSVDLPNNTAESYGPWDNMVIEWSQSNDSIPNETYVHVGATPDVWDWVTYVSYTGATASGQAPNGQFSQNFPITPMPVHVWSSPQFSETGTPAGANASGPNQAICGACMTTAALVTNFAVSGLEIIGPPNCAAVSNLQIADVTGMGLTISNLNAGLVAQLQASNLMITVTNFGAYLCDGEQYVVVLQGDPAYLPAETLSNGNYTVLDMPYLLQRELFAVVTSTDGHTLVNNYTLLNMPPMVASTFTVRQPSFTVGPGVGTNSIVLAAPSVSSSWTASANASWLHLSPANQAGTGSTNVVYTVDANIGPTRTGTLTLGGQTVTITQAGSPYVKAPAPVTTLVSNGLDMPWGVDVDNWGNVYIADQQNNAVKEWIASNNTVITLVSNGLNQPSGVTVDGLGNVYITDGKNNAIKKWIAASGAVVTVISNGLGLNNPYHTALDRAGNIYIANFNAGNVVEWLAASNTLSTLIPSSQLNGPTSVSVDVAGNVYVSSYSGRQVLEWVAANSNLVTLFSPLSNSQPNVVAADGGGNLIIGDNNPSDVERWSFATGGLSSLISSGLNSPQDVALDAAGDIYIADRYNNAVKELPYAFVNPTPILEGSGAGTGVLPAILPVTANLNAPFAPSSSQPSWLTILGATNGVISFAFTSNGTGSNRTAQITVLGQGISITQSTDPAPVVDWSTPAPIVYGTALSSNEQLNATANVPGAFSYNPSAGTVLAAGTYSLTTVFTPSNASYLSITDSVSLVVSPATPVVTLPALGEVAAGTALSTNLLDATASVPGTFTYYPPPGTVLAAGVNTVWLVFTPNDTNDYSSVTTSVSLDVGTVMLTGLNLTATPADNPTGQFPAVDTTGFFGPAGSNIFLSAAQIGLYNSSGSPTANQGVLDSVHGTFSMNFGQAAGFVVYDATGTNRVGTAQLLAVTPVSGAFNTTNGTGSFQMTEPVSATMLLENSAGALTEADDVVIIVIIIVVPCCIPPPPCCCCDPWDVTNSVTSLTLGLPATLGGGSLNASLTGTFQTVATNVLVTPAPVLSSTAVPLRMTAFSATAVPANNLAGNFAAVDPTGFFGPAGSSIFLSPLHFQLFAPPSPVNTGYIDPGKGTFAMNWGQVATFKVFDYTGTNQVGSGLLPVVSPQLGSYDATNQLLTSLSAVVSSSPGTWFAYNNSGGVAVEPDDYTNDNTYYVTNILTNICTFCPVISQYVLNLPDNTNIVSELTAIGPSLLGSASFSAVLTTASATFEAQTPIETASFDSLEHVSLGNAVFGPSSNQLVVGNLGVSGLDGAAISVNPEQGFALDWEDPDSSNSLPAGVYLDEEIFGTGGSVTNGLLGRIQFIKAGSSNFICMADFSPMGSTMMNVQALDGGELEYEAREVYGVVFISPRLPTDWEYNQQSSMMYATYGPPIPSVGFHGTAVPAYEVGMAPLGPTGTVLPMRVTSVELLSGGIPQIILTNENTTVLYGGLIHSSLGHATLSVQANQLTVANIGASGQDGLQISFVSNFVYTVGGYVPSNLLSYYGEWGFTNWGVQWQDLDPSNVLPLGAFLQIQQIGTALGVTNGLLGTVTETKGFSNSVLSADFTPVGVSNFTVQFFSGGNLLSQRTGVPTGPLCYLFKAPQTGLAPGTIKSGDFFNPFTKMFRSFYDTFASYEPLGAQTNVDNIAIIPSGWPATNLPLAIVIRASQIPSITLTNEVVQPLLLNSTVTGTNLQFQWYGTGLLQSSPSLNFWNTLSNSTSPYLQPIGTSNQFFRLMESAPQEGNF